MLVGTRIFRRAMASWRFSISPTHSSRVPAGRTTELGDFFLGLQNRAANIASAHAVFDRHVAFLLLAINEGRAGSQLDVGDLAERHLDLAIRPLRADGDVANGVEILPVARGKAHHHRKMPVAALLIEVARGLAADRGLNDRIDIASHKAVARRLVTIDVDRHRRLANRRQNSKVGDPFDGRQHILDLVSGGVHLLQVGSEQLDRILAFHAGCGFLDIVLDILRGVEVDPGEVGLQFVDDLFRKLLFGEPLRPFGRRLQRHVEFGIAYPVHVTTRKSLGDMTRKLSVTESRSCAQLRGTFSRRNSSVASANWVHVA